MVDGVVDGSTLTLHRATKLLILCSDYFTDVLHGGSLDVHGPVHDIINCVWTREVRRIIGARVMVEARHICPNYSCLHTFINIWFGIHLRVGAPSSTVRTETIDSSDYQDAVHKYIASELSPMHGDIVTVLWNGTNDCVIGEARFAAACGIGVHVLSVLSRDRARQLVYSDNELYEYVRARGGSDLDLEPTRRALHVQIRPEYVSEECMSHGLGDVVLLLSRNQKPCYVQRDNQAEKIVALDQD